MRRDPYLESRVLTADPLELIYMIYQHAIDMVEDARGFLASGDIAGRSTAICRALEALSELDGSLDHAKGGEISRNLAQLYQHMRSRLTVANVNQQDGPLAEVETLLRTLADAWKALSGKRAEPAGQEFATEPRAAAPWGVHMAETPVEYSSHNWSA